MSVFEVFLRGGVILVAVGMGVAVLIAIFVAVLRWLSNR